jgi:N-dimethylarginine dimethylaminohydrolase
MSDPWERSQWGVCYICGDKMIQGGDHDTTNMDGVRYIESNFQCQKCETHCLFSWPIDK